MIDLKLLFICTQILVQPKKMPNLLGLDVTGVQIMIPPLCVRIFVVRDENSFLV
jgi:hypothetical protein